MKTHFPLLVLLGLGFTSAASHSAIVFAQDAAAGSTSYDSLIAVNLIRAGQSTLGSMTTTKPSHLGPTFKVEGLNDGSAAANGNFTYWGTKNSANLPEEQLPVTITFALAGSATGYDITSIQAIAGWGDSNLGSQSFQLLLSINNGAYTDFGTYTNTTTLGGGNNATLSTLTDSLGVIASGVTGVQFVFLDPDPGREFQAGDGGTLIRELQAFGTATAVPEPQTAGLAVAGLALCTFIRRRRCR